MPKSRKRNWKGRDRKKKRLRAALRRELSKRALEPTVSATPVVAE